jgi:hypothetical protein
MADVKVESAPVLTENKSKVKRVGTRVEVFNGLAQKTSGGLTKEDIVMEHGRFKSKRAVQRGKALISQLRGAKDSNNAELPEPAKPKDLTDAKVVKPKRAPRKPKEQKKE